MVLEPICCLNCHTTNVVKMVKVLKVSSAIAAATPSVIAPLYILNYSYRGLLPEVKQQIADMTVNGSGIRDTARVLQISLTTVIEELKNTLSA